MFIKFALLVSVALTLIYQVNSASMTGKNNLKTTDEDSTKSLVDFYNCTGKPDGNYIHPFDCTKFISCVAQSYAYEKNCADCPIDPETCPTRRLHYHQPDDACLYANQAGCVVDPPSPTPPTTCNPDNCLVTGYCHDYSWCERDASDHKGTGKNGTIKHGICDENQNLYFNPNKNGVHGGVCDFLENLEQETKDKYNSDPNCIDPHCEWKPDSEKDCSSKYWYFHPQQNNGTDQELHCPTRSDGEFLIWDQSVKNCQPCNSVKDSNGNPCCSA